MKHNCFVVTETYPLSLPQATWLRREWVLQELQLVPVLGFSPLGSWHARTVFLLWVWQYSHLQSPAPSDLICLRPTPLKTCRVPENRDACPRAQPMMPQPSYGTRVAHRLRVWGPMAILLALSPQVSFCHLRHLPLPLSNKSRAVSVP